MKFAAIKGQMGIWKYYVTTFSFEQICKLVSPITKEISNSESYSNLLQRSITDNVKSITDYLLNQPERLFNSLVLAVYDGYPEWYELDVEVGEYSTYSVGVLEFSGDETIFPVDGQHRAEGIKAAVAVDSSLRNEKVPVILIGHENSPEGKKRTRRLFSTLNRRAKRVKDNEIIALDEDDVIAIATRELAENHRLFIGERLVDEKTKNISPKNRYAFTSILTLYEINKYLFDEYAKTKKLKGQEKEKYLLYRPEEKAVNEFIHFVEGFWDAFCENIPLIKKYVLEDKEQIESQCLRSGDGGNLLFRPIALSQFVIATIEYKNRKETSLDEALQTLSRIPMIIQEKPWKNVLWLDERKIINGRARKKDLMLMMLFMVDETLLQKKEKDMLIKYLMALRNMDESGYEEVEDSLRNLV